MNLDEQKQLILTYLRRKKTVKCDDKDIIQLYKDYTRTIGSNIDRLLHTMYLEGTLDREREPHRPNICGARKWQYFLKQQ